MSESHNEAGQDMEPGYYGLEGAWRMGHMPRNAEDWAIETRMRLGEAASAVSAAEAEAERAASASTEWATGRRPETEREWQLEYSFRELDKARQAEQARQDSQYNASVEAARESLRSTNVRSWVLLAIVASIIIMPAVAMASGVAAQSFSQYIAPITGIAGTVLGYWFSQQNGSVFQGRRADAAPESTSPSSSGFPTAPPAADRP
jgi:hypothetical protein